MKGDFSRDTFDPTKYFTRVLMQQGRVQVDADWNEQASIVLDYLRTLATDSIGDHGGLKSHFAIGNLSSNDFTIGGGHYYVQGLRCNNPKETKYSEFPLWRRPGVQAFQTNNNYFLYLDVWERHVTHVVDDDIREKALGGPDTATRTQLMWQIRAEETTLDSSEFDKFLESRRRPGTGTLSASTKAAASEGSKPGTIPPESRYRGAENQLYRVEIHREKDASDPKSTATWKWSRDNGVVVFPIRTLNTDGKTTVVSVEHLGRDDRYGLKIGDWVEVVDDDYELLGQADPLLKVSDVLANELQVILEKTPKSPDVGRDGARHPLLRRWDQRQTSKIRVTEQGVIAVAPPGTWIELEDGISIAFPSKPDEYKTGDYWLIPARVATGDIQWPRDPKDSTKPAARPPNGVQHYYAPLEHIAINAGGNITPTSLRNSFKPLTG